MSQSIITEQSINTIIQELALQIFDNNATCDIIVYPSEEGGFIKKFGIKVILGASFIAGNMVPDFTNGVVKGLTGIEVSDHVANWTHVLKNGVENFIEKKNSDLNSDGITYDSFYQAYNAKNKLYHAAISNPDAKGIGFQVDDVFSVQRNEFAYRTINLSENTSPIDPIEKYHELIVISSINTKEESKLAWQVKDKINKKRFDIYMCDNDFYEGFLNKPIILKNMVVKAQYKLKRDEEGHIQIDRKEITKVYSFNGQILFSLPPGATIEPAPYIIAGAGNNASIYVSAPQQESLFDNCL